MGELERDFVGRPFFECQTAPPHYVFEHKVHGVSITTKDGHDVVPFLWSLEHANAAKEQRGEDQVMVRQLRLHEVLSLLENLPRGVKVWRLFPDQTGSIIEAAVYRREVIKWMAAIEDALDALEQDEDSDVHSATDSQGTGDGAHGCLTLLMFAGTLVAGVVTVIAV